MKKVIVTPVHQNSYVFYAMIANPRDIAALMKRAKSAEVQENQRPWDKRKVQEIARFVSGFMKFGSHVHRMKGLLPNAPIICLTDKLKIQLDVQTKQYYVMLPETREEFKEYGGCIEVIDGQHRILAFAEDLRDPGFSDETTYEMIFSVFEPMAKEEKKELFMVTNEKQTKVESNLLRLFKKQLHLLDEDESLFDFVVRLNEEDFSPLKGRIMIGSDHIAKGYKEGQLSKILARSTTYDKLSRLVKEDDSKETKMCKGLSLYLQAWETVYKVSFRTPGKETLTKISGLRYILYLFPDMMEILRDQNKPATKDSFETLIRLLPKATGVADVFNDEETSLAFRGEGATVKLAKDHGKQLIAYNSSEQTHANPADVW